MLVRAWGTSSPEGYHGVLAVEDPAAFTAAAFKQALINRGITVTGTAVTRHRVSDRNRQFVDERAEPLKLSRSQQLTIEAPVEGRKVLATHTSVPVAEDMMLTNKISQNLHAELLLRLLGKVHGTDGSFEQGARVVRQFLIGAGVDDNDFFIYDGSGMSPSTASPRVPIRNCWSMPQSSRGERPGATLFPSPVSMVHWPWLAGSKIRWSRAAYGPRPARSTRPTPSPAI